MPQTRAVMPGHLPERPALAELLEPAELRDVEPRVAYLPVVVEVDRDLRVPLDPRHRVDDDALGHESFAPSPTRYGQI